jgi:hypothetical protein
MADTRPANREMQALRVKALAGGGRPPSRAPPAEGRMVGRANPALRVHHAAMASVAKIGTRFRGVVKRFATG